MQLARKLLLTTEWIVEAGQKHGQVSAKTLHHDIFHRVGQAYDCLFMVHIAEGGLVPIPFKVEQYLIHDERQTAREYADTT